MLPDNGKAVKQEYDYCPTDEELMALLRYVAERKVRPHFKLITWLLAFTGRRPSEVLALNIRDFPGVHDLDFSKAWMRLAKQNKVVQIHLVEPLQRAVIEYLYPKTGAGRRGLRNLPGGWLFPSRSCNSVYDRPFMRAEDYGAFFSKARRALWDQYPGFKEKNPSTGIYRIHPHSLRHWFETHAAEASNPIFVKELMHYSRLETVMTYVSTRKAREKIPAFMEQHYGPLLQMARGMVPGQQCLAQFDPAAKF
jgi:integrase